MFKSEQQNETEGKIIWDEYSTLVAHSLYVSASIIKLHW